MTNKMNKIPPIRYRPNTCEIAETPKIGNSNNDMISVFSIRVELKIRKIYNYYDIMMIHLGVKTQNMCERIPLGRPKIRYKDLIKNNLELLSGDLK